MKYLRDKRIIKLSILFLLLMAMCQLVPTTHSEVQAASVAKRTRKAKALYKKKIRSIYKKSEYYSYKITNLCGDKVPELIVDYTLPGARHGNVDIFMYKGKKLKRILKSESDNMNIYVYKKTGFLIISTSYHDYKEYEYYRSTKSSYKLKAVKCYNGSIWNSYTQDYGKWWYESATRNQISKTRFNKLIKGIGRQQSNLRWSSVKYHIGCR